MAVAPDQLARFAARLAREAAFVGSVLTRYAESEKITPTVLAARLNLPLERFHQLHLCFRPRPDRFAEDVDVVAGEVGLDPAVLAAIVCRVEAIDAMTGSVTPAAGALLAARKPAKPKGTP